MKYLSILWLAITMVACSQGEPIKSLEGLDIRQINKHLKATPWGLTPTDIIKLYHNKEPRESAEGTETVSITTDGSAVTGATITLVHDNLIEGPIKATRTIMVLKQKGEQWEVLTIDKSWKCWRDSEGADWKTTPCT